jgi:hypothetical protein
VELFFPVSDDEREALLGRAWAHQELAGLHQIAWDNAGVNEDAIWVAAEVLDDVARRYEEPDSEYLGYRSFVLPGELLNTLAWRYVVRRGSCGGASRGRCGCCGSRAGVPA